MIGAISEAMTLLLTPEAAIIIVVGALIGTLMGAIPGLGGSITLALLIPFSFTLNSEMGVLLLISALGGVNYGGSIPAIMLNIPGTSPSVITTIDGYEMTKDNRAGEALGASATASVLGAIIGVAFLIVTIPVIRNVLLYFGPPEFLLVSVIGLLIVGTALRGSAFNGLLGVTLGVVLGFHGFNSITGATRFDFGQLYLYDGVQLLLAIIGLFAISEMIVLQSGSPTGSQTASGSVGKLKKGVHEVLRRPKLVFESALTGIIVGVIPAVGATVSTLIAYSRAEASTKDSSRFGKGDVRGVIAPEASNDAKDGASLLPTLAFSIPGSPSHAVLLGGLLFHGITPGPGLFGSQSVHLIYFMVFGLLMANIVTSVVGLASANQIVKVTDVPMTVLIPVIVVISFFGSYAFRGNPIDMFLVLVLGLIGYLAVRTDISRIGILFGLILGPIIEDTFHQTTQIARGEWSAIYTRPVFLILLIGMIAVIVYQQYSAFSRKSTRPS